MLRRWSIWALFLVGLVACSGENHNDSKDIVTDLSGSDTMLDVALDGADGVESDVTEDVAGVDLPLEEPSLLWPDEFVPPPETSQFVTDNPWLSNFSLWSFALNPGDKDLSFRDLPDLATGNGRVFSLMGYAFPMNTLHSMIGPTYEKGDGFFGDSWLEITRGVGGSVLGWQKQWLGRVRQGPFVVTQFVNPVVSFHTIDFAPLTTDRGSPLMRALLRVVVVRNTSADVQSDLVLRVGFDRAQEVVGQSVLETRTGKERVVTWIGAGAMDAIAQTDSLLLPVADLPSGEERVYLLAYVMDDAADQSEATLEALGDGSALVSLMEETRDEWVDQLAPGAVIETPDPRVNDYLEGAKVIILQQQANTGATCPMSQYTGIWLRDTAGPVRFFSRCGLLEKARAMIDYQWNAANFYQGIQNSTEADLAFDPLPEVADWNGMAGMSGRSKAESPSYIPINYYIYWKASGVSDWLEKRFDFLQFALRGQQFNDDKLLPFSGDETFRTAMAMATGYPVDESFEEGFLSSNSSFLWVAAAEQMAQFAGFLGDAEGEAHWSDGAAEVRQAADSTYLDENGMYRPYFIEADGSLAAAGFEDVNTKPTWTGYLDPLSEAAAAHLVATINNLGGEDGILVSPLPDAYKNYMGLPVAEGVYTGMSPGYFLANLALAFHPVGTLAFNALEKHLTATGTTPEYEILDNFTPLQIIYDPTGGVGDYTARYRPWEGGILADAAWEFLLGFRPDAPAGRFKLSPYLPNGWSWLNAKGLRIGEARVDLSIEVRDTEYLIVLESDSTDVVELDLRVPFVPDGQGPVNGRMIFAPGISATVNGEAVDLDVETLNWGTQLVSLPMLELASGVPVEIVLTR